MWAVIAWICLAWYLTIWSICLLGLSLARSYFLPPIPRSPLSPLRPSQLAINTPSIPANSASHDDHDAAGAAPGVSILRPLSGLDCNLYSNLSSSFQQDYPHQRFEILLSIKHLDSSEAQKVYSIAQKVISKHPHVSARIIVGDEQAGVNPKINNLVQPFSQARFDILWVVDSQVWSPPGALARAVDALLLTGSRQPRPVPALLRRRPHGHRVGLVHHVPLAVLPGTSWGSQVERVFLSTTHAKMYLAINSLALDSCVMGKSNMYRKSDLEAVPDAFFEVGSGGSRGESGAIGSGAFDQSGASSAYEGPNPGLASQQQPLLSSTDDTTASTTTAPATSASSSIPPSLSSSATTAPLPTHPPTSTIRTTSRALARFAIYLAEDNMLALSLWRAPLSLSHVLAPGDVANTAVGDVRTLSDYATRRMRWIRVRKHMVLAATLVEPLTESILAGLMGLVAFRWFVLGTSTGWVGTLAFLLVHFAAWLAVDLGVMVALQAGVPPPRDEWATIAQAWCIRELLALPIWAWAVSGSTVLWRDKHYQILTDGRAATISARPKAPTRSTRLQRQEASSLV